MYIVVVFTVLDGPVLCDPHELEEATDMSSEGDERLHLSCKGSERGSKLFFVWNGSRDSGWRHEKGFCSFILFSEGCVNITE
jgi:hypothetical protein